MRCALLLVAAAAATANAQTAGMEASLSQAGINYMLQQFIPVIEAKVGNIAIPDIPWDQDGFEGTVSSISCKSFTINSATVATAAPNSVTVTIDDVSIACSANWDFKLKIWPHVPDGSGSADISVSQTNGAIALGVSADTKLNPQLTLTSASISIGSLDITFHGSAWDWLLDLVKSLLENSIKGSVQSAFASALGSLVADDINPVLAALQLQIPLHVKAPYNISEVRFGLVSNPTCGANYVGLQMQGDIVPLANPVSPPLPAPVLPPFGAQSGDYYFEADVSTYTFLSAAYTYYTAGLMAWQLHASDLPLGLNNSAGYSLIAPGLVTAYPNAAIQCFLQTAGMPLGAIAPAGITTTLPINLTFQAVLSNGSVVNAFTLSSNTSLSLLLALGPDPAGAFAINGNLTYLSSQLSVASSAVGTVNVGLIQAGIDIIYAAVVLPIVNSLLNGGFPLPSAPGLAFTNASLALQTGYAALSADFTFNPTAFISAGAARAAVPVPLPPAMLRGRVA